MKKMLLCFLLVMVGASSASAADVVRLGTLKFAHYGAVWYMKEIAPKYDLEIKESVFPKGIDIIPAIIAGEIDVAASAVDGAIVARASDVPIVIVAGFAKGGARIVGRSDMKWSSVADLKGKKVGVPRGGAQELVLLAELGKYNLTFSEKPDKDVQIVYMAYADMNQALMAKNIDAMCQSEPQSTQAISKGFGVEIIKPYDTPIGEPVRTLIMTEAMYNTRKDVAERFMKCFVDATKYFIDNPKAAEQYVREKMFKGQLTAEDYHDAIDNSTFTYDVTVQQVQVSTDMMVKYGIGKMAKPPKAKEYVKLDLLEKAKKELKVK
ncbi:MAG: myristoyl transferase [Nitrospirae bacterium GWC2_57_13]|jgi:NitT/TauT family transport system substrate-binding protein|nr:MAG: myristoyl transferase [Nitrospirae bacterium GWC2_57_13]HAR46154.1 myristoyl transferase [Nitrospiraceae bacterium]HAS54027.1 myristoyl transferase [Nitrospiraceae bacterium]